MARSLAGCLAIVLLASITAAAEPFAAPAIRVPPGWTVELAAAPPLVAHPIMAGFDDRGRLYLAENAGENLPRAQLEERLPNSVVRLEDVDGDGRFDRRTLFADRLTFPQGALWHAGWLYVASSGAIWRFRDANDDGVAEIRERIVSQFGYTGNAADVHGCFLGPEGRIYWCEGRHGHEITGADGEVLSQGKAARIFSCRPDGGDVQTHCGGGLDNPVEIDWTDAGEMLGTANIFLNPRGDCLVHWLHGGVYPRHDQPAVLAEFRRTGDLLGPVHDFGHVAVSGLCRYRSPLPAFPSPNPNPISSTWFVTEFNTHQVRRVTLARQGASFQAQSHEFLQAASDDFHPTDVLEDADGSLLVIDTGGWFRLGCPTSQLAKPDILGAIYRLRPPGPAVADPRGRALAWDRPTKELAERLTDSRFAVREQAAAALVQRGDKAVPALAAVARQPAGNGAAAQAAWALVRIGTEPARAALRSLLASGSDEVRLAAAQGLGRLRDAPSRQPLSQWLAHSAAPPLAREAAAALGRLKDQAAVPALLPGLTTEDPALRHALVYALIEINDPSGTAAGLTAPSPAVRRGALVALDQMPAGDLSPSQLLPLLRSDDAPLRAAALGVAARKPALAEAVLKLLEAMLVQPALAAAEEELLAAALAGLSQPQLEALASDRMPAERVNRAAKRLLLEELETRAARPVSPELPARLVALAAEEREDELAAQAIRTLAAVAPEALLKSLRPQPERVLRGSRGLALLTSLPAGEELQPAELDYLFAALAPERQPTDRLLAARGLAKSRLADAAWRRLMENLAGQDSFVAAAVLGNLAPIAERGRAEALAAALDRCDKQGALWGSEAARQALGSFDFPQLRRPVAADQAAARARLEQLEGELSAGRAGAGRAIFQSQKVGCAACHRVGKEGGLIGPDLTKVGQRRAPRDLLEAVLVPSASLARGYESFTIACADGQVVTGLIVRESADALVVRTADQREVRLRRSQIEELRPSPVSIMPAGLDNALSREQLADLLAYLQSLK